MLTIIPDLLSAHEVARIRAKIDGAKWVDRSATSGTQSALAKRNAQLPEDGDAAREAGTTILDALARSALFVATALPLKVFAPLFNRYADGQAFLSDPADYDGGELVIENTFGEQSVKLPAAAAVVYPASSLHRVTPVTRGIRVASVLWLQSMIRDDGARRILFDLDQGVQAVAGACGQGDAAVVRLTGVYHNLLRRWAEM